MTQNESTPRRNGRRLVTVLLALVGLALALIVVPTAGAETTALGSLGPATEEGGCTECTTFQPQASPDNVGYIVPPGRWTISSWSGQSGKLGGSARLDVFRPAAQTGQYLLLAQSALEAFPAGTVASFPAAIQVEGGDVLGLVSGPDGSYPIAYVNPDPEDVLTGVIGAPQVGQTVGPGTAEATFTTSGYRLNLAAELTPSQDPVPTTSGSTTNVLDLLVEGNGTLAVAGTTLDCPRICASNFPTGTSMNVTETPGPHAEFAGWSGGVCTGTALTCPVTLGAELRVTGRFIPAHGMTLGPVKRKVKHGRVRTVQRAKVENRGTVKVSGRGVVATKVHAGKAGGVTLHLVARGKALRTLARTGTAATNVRVTFTPDGGTPNTVKEKVSFTGGRG
jgi:hypothetical protein